MALKKNASLRAALSVKETDEDLNRMESDIRKLKIEYEQFFGGGKARPPSDTEWRIEQIIKRYGDRGAEMNFGQRFRYGNLAQTFAKYKEIFHKRVRKREEGTVDRHFGAAARQIEAERARRRKEEPPELVAVRCADPGQEPKKVDQIYRAFREALERSGQPTDKLSRESFEKFLQRKIEQFRQKSGKDVEIIVSVEGGKPSLKARVKA
jgi:hypothetical protein